MLNQTPKRAAQHNALKKDNPMSGSLMRTETDGYTAIVGSGILSFDRIRETMEKLYTESQIALPPNVLWDLRHADIRRLSSAEMEELPRIASRWARARAGGKTALVAEEEVNFAVTRLISAFSENLPVAVRAFRNLEAARLWLTAPEVPSH
jgi:hypothetical protein